MQDKQKNNIPMDDFSNALRQKLEDHRMQVDAACWNEIEYQLQPKRKYSLWWIGGSVAAIAVIAVLLLSIPVTQEPPFEPLTNQSNIDIEIKKDKQNKPEDTISVVNKTVIPNRQMQSLDLAKVNNTHSAKGVTENNSVIIDSTDIYDIERAIDKTQDISIAESVTTSDSAQSTQQKQHFTKSENKHYPEKILIDKKRNENDKWLVAAAFSSGNNLSSKNSTVERLYALSSSYTNSDETDSPPGLISDVRKTIEYDDVQHSLPLSIGVSVRKDLNKHIGIETGVTYTYLSSKFKFMDSQIFNAEQQLHYIGIPVNVIVYLWNNPKWNLYVSGGGMAEKGLRYNYTQDISNGSEITQMREKGSVDGLQWSLNASVGLSYTIFDSWSLYAEPRFSYYFDNNQPISIRTEKSSVFSLGAGLRYKF